MSDLTHLDAEGRARMVDVGGKAETARTAYAEGSITMSFDALDAIERQALSKGDAIAAARIAGIMAAKRTADLIPLCHPIALTDAGLDVEVDRSLPGLHVTAWASTHGRTGVEMEALMAVTIALLTIYDMAKALDRGMQISGVRLVEKRGGKSGHWKRE
ncbi:MAG TPA: cyclic pyranopterin monophosphate synthase MoaC [Gemmatimonadaceae bacterium]|jgi:cyclic pyranopterin phosphate synthase|nr:cyclic pyranopterin monophosphate synthase MoaC [Gemmatimonadaceae bacterium]